MKPTLRRRSIRRTHTAPEQCRSGRSLLTDSSSSTTSGSGYTSTSTSSCTTYYVWSSAGLNTALSSGPFSRRDPYIFARLSQRDLIWKRSLRSVTLAGPLTLWTVLPVSSTSQTGIYIDSTASGTTFYLTQMYTLVSKGVRLGLMNRTKGWVTTSGREGLRGPMNRQNMAPGKGGEGMPVGHVGVMIRSKG